MCGIVSRVVPGGKKKQEAESARVRDMWSGARREEIQTMLRFPFRDGEVHRCAGQTMERGRNKQVPARQSMEMPDGVQAEAQDRVQEPSIKRGWAMFSWPFGYTAGLPGYNPGYVIW